MCNRQWRYNVQEKEKGCGCLASSVTVRVICAQISSVFACVFDTGCPRKRFLAARLATLCRRHRWLVSPPPPLGAKGR